MVILRVKGKNDRTIRYRSVAAFDVDMDNRILNYSPYLDDSEWHEPTMRYCFPETISPTPDEIGG